jgi:hypothetical protein
MSMLSPVLAPNAPDLSALLRRLHRDEPVYTGLTLLLLAALPAMLVAAAVDGRSVLGNNIWTKPLKFELSLAVYIGTLAVFARWVPAGDRASRLYRFFRAAVVAAVLAEMIWIGGAAMLGTTSHFNTSPLGSVLYPAMGLAAVLITSATTVQAWQIARNRATGLPPSIKASIVIGLAMVLPLTLLTAGTMASMQGHSVGATDPGPAGTWIFGWSREAGDLRVAHFFATHALHAVPLFGLIATVLMPRYAETAVKLFATAYTGFVLLVFGQALAGRPFLAGIL